MTCKRTVFLNCDAWQWICAPALKNEVIVEEGNLKSATPKVFFSATN